MSEEERKGVRERGEEALGEFTQALLENPLFNQALVAAVGAGERAVQAQRSALAALDVPTSSDVERLVRRLRSLSDRLEAIEDTVDELGRDVASLRRRLEGGDPAPSDQG